MIAVDDLGEPIDVRRADARAPVVVVCEHASNRIPGGATALGLPQAAGQAHIAWDPGALGVADALADALGATRVAGTVSRLVYDLNRPPSAPDAMPARSETYDIPGNAALDDAGRKARVEAVYNPFHNRLAGLLAVRSDPILVTVHSFTPVYHGQPRETRIGILHDTDARLADAMLDTAPMNLGPVRRNDPYGPADGVTHMLVRHGVSEGRLNVMIEIRNDLITTPAEQQEMGERLADWLVRALEELDITLPGVTA